MPSLSLALNASTARKPIGGDSVIWRILISGAGTTTSNGEYVWDGVTVSLGKPFYMSGINPLFWDGAKWYIGDEDGLGGDTSYSSGDLITWTIENGDSPAPSSTLYYTP
jgi:hypothetical protein